MASEESSVAAAQELRMAVGRVARRLRQLYADERESAVSFIEISILVHLARSGPSSPSALAVRESVTTQAIAGVVRELESRGLVERSGNPRDRRRVVIAITEAGRELLSSHEHAVVQAIVTALADDYSPAERRRLRAAVPLLDRLADRL
jgi:DNA-binding MarR family transcriptional regulator